MTISLAALAAQRANAAYEETVALSQAAFSKFGDAWIAMYQKPGIQAVLSVDLAGNPWLSISGTRPGLTLDVFEDISIEMMPVKGGNVTKGVYEGMSDLWSWVLETAPTGAKFSVCGHSLGASRTHLTPLFIPQQQIGPMFSFEAPKFCDAAYYATYKSKLATMTCFLDGEDLWASFPVGLNARPIQLHVWLKGDEGQYVLIDGDQWPGGINPADHSMDRVQARVIALINALNKTGTK
jgi:hypothetical protein